eukprot:5193006-Prorocentrum_lima.AAC.1
MAPWSWRSRAVVVAVLCAVSGLAILVTTPSPRGDDSGENGVKKKKKQLEFVSGRSGLTLSLIHISEPTRLDVI